MSAFIGSLRVAFPSAALLLAAACGGAKQADAVSPGAAELQGQEPAASAAVPDTPTASNVHISSEILRACGIPDANAYFAFDSARLRGDDRGPLDAVATCFRTGALKGRRMRLVGHADPRGTDDYNVVLGQSRADAVSGYLAGRGLSHAVMTTTSRGALDATGQDEAGWAQDRRVDIRLVK